MRRFVFVGAVAIALGLVLADPLFAQEGWPPYYNGNSDPHFLPRGPGFYFSIWKVVLSWIAFLIYVRCTDWVNRDVYDVGDKVGLQPALWNSVCMYPFPVVLFATWAIPNGLAFWGGFVLMLVAAFRKSLHCAASQGVVQRGQEGPSSARLGSRSANRLRADGRGG
jgi:hypothetical protein